MYEKINEKLLKLKVIQLPLINKIYTKLFTKEIISYLFWGFLTTILNFLTFTVLTNYIFFKMQNEDLNIIFSNTIAFIIAVLFAFFTNRKFVFNSQASDTKSYILELIKFFSVRIFTFLLNLICILLLVNFLFFTKLIAKIFSNILEVILNYFFSKIIVFKKK